MSKQQISRKYDIVGIQVPLINTAVASGRGAGGMPRGSTLVVPNSLAVISTRRIRFAISTQNCGNENER